MVRRDLVIDAKGNFLPAKQIQQRLALPSTPTFVCNVTVPADSQLLVGIARQQEMWGVVGGGEQVYVKDVSKLVYSVGTMLAK